MIRKIRNKNNNTELTFADHLSELRTRILVIIASFITFSAVGYYFRTDIIQVLIAPLNQHLFFTSPTGAFEFAIQVAIIFGFFLTIPIIIYHILGFLEPIFSDKVKKAVHLLIIFSSLFLVLGILSAYFIFIPLTLTFLLSFDPQLESLITAKEYMNFITFYLFSFVLIFQLPLIMVLITCIYPVSIKKLLSFQRMVIAVSFLIAAFLTPTFDIFNQIIVAVPIILIYQISVVFVWFFKEFVLEK